MSSALRSLAFVAQSCGIQIDTARLQREFLLEANQEPDQDLLCEIAKQNGLKAKRKPFRWKDLLKLDHAFPLIVHLKNKHYAVISKVDENSNQVTLVDTSKAQNKPIEVSKERFLRAWDGSALLISNAKGLSQEGTSSHISFSTLLKQNDTRQAFLAKTILIALLSPLLIIIPLLCLNAFINSLSMQGAALNLTLISTASLLSLCASVLVIHQKQRYFLRASEVILSSINHQVINHAFHHSSNENLDAEVQHWLASDELLGAIKNQCFDKTDSLYQSAVYFLMLLLINIELAAVLFVIASLALLSLNFTQKMSLESGKSQQNWLLQASELTGHISMVDEIKRQNLSTRVSLELKNKADNQLRNQTTAQLKILSLSSVQRMITQISITAFVVISASLVLSGYITPGIAIISGIIGLLVYFKLNHLVSQSSKLKYYESLYSNVLALLNSEHSPHKATPKIEGNLQIRDMSFLFSSQKILDSVNLKIASGDKVALTGPPGSGKTTLLQLIEGSLQPTTGTIFYDGYERHQLDGIELMTNICAYCAPNATLFFGTIRDNIRSTKPGISDKDFKRVLEISGLDRCADYLPEGLDTKVIGNGDNIPSSIIRQISLARALLKKPKILLLDNILCELSPANRRSFFLKLDQFLPRCTTISAVSSLEEAQEFKTFYLLGSQVEKVENTLHSEAAPREERQSSTAIKKELGQRTSKLANTSGPASNSLPAQEIQNTQTNKASSSKTHKTMEQTERHHLEESKTHASPVKSSRLAELLNNARKLHTEVQETVEDEPAKAKASLKDHIDLKALGERLQRNNLQAKLAKEQEEEQSFEDKPETKKINNDALKPDGESSKSDSFSINDQAQGPDQELTQQEQSLSSMIEGYFKHD